MLTDVRCSELLGIANAAIMLSGKCKISFYRLSIQTNQNSEKILRFSNIISSCDTIIQTIYQYIDQEDPMCSLPSHPAKLISDVVPSPKRVHIALKRAKKDFQPSDPDTENLFEKLSHSYYEIEKEFREDI